MSETDVQVEVAIIGNKIKKERAQFLQERLYEEIGKAIHNECQTLDSALSGKSQYDDTHDLILFKIEISVVVNRRLSQRFLRLIVDNALQKVFFDLGHEWAMQSIEIAADTLTESVNAAAEAIDKAWDTALSTIARELKSAVAALEGKKSDSA